MASRSMQHCNGSDICAIDVETTGLIPGFHEIIEIAIVPLDANLQRRNDVQIFNIQMRPDRVDAIDKQAMRVNKADLSKLMTYGVDQITGCDLFINWVENELKPTYNKYGSYPNRIIPLGHNYQIDLRFIIDWMGVDLYEQWFHPVYRDTMVLSACLNDYASFKASKVPYSKNSLEFLKGHLQTPDYGSHKALFDALTTADVYRAMVLKGLPIL